MAKGYIALDKLINNRRLTSRRLHFGGRLLEAEVEPVEEKARRKRTLTRLHKAEYDDFREAA